MVKARLLFPFVLLPIGVCTSFISPIISNFDADSDALWFLENVKVLAASRMENVWEDEGW